jgi:orotate phosphoribosyltransferase
MGKGTARGKLVRTLDSAAPTPDWRGNATRFARAVREQFAMTTATATQFLPAAKRARLIEIVKARSFSRGAEMKLASGRTSNFYFNMKPTMLHPEGADLIGALIVAAIAADKADLIGGLEMGAVPIATAVATVSHTSGQPVPAFFVRKQAKEHGTQSLIEGLAPGESLTGKRVVIVEDVTTTGGSAIKAADAVKAAGGTVVRVVTVVDRQEGAEATFAAAGLVFTAILTANDFN